MRKALSLSDFSRLAVGAPDNARLDASSILITDGLQDGESSGRTISYVFSDESVARDGHTISSSGWDLDAFKSNPVFLWAHDSSSPPVGRVTSVVKSGARLLGTVEYADADTYPFADTIFRLTKGKFLNATSVSWLPIEWKHSTDRSRPGGIDFLKQELLEVSAVPVPALKTALVTARGQGIDTAPIFDWATRMLDAGGVAAIPRAELEQIRKEARMPTARKPADLEPAAAVEVAPAVPELGKRSLWNVGWLAMLLADLGCLKNSVEWEAVYEESDSTVPADLLAALKALGETLVKMTAEEVQKLLADDDEETIVVEVMASDLDLKRAAIGRLRRLDARGLHGVLGVMRDLAAGRRIFVKVEDAPDFTPLLRAGKTISADNERCLREAHDEMTRAHGHIKSAAKKVKSVADANDDDDEDAEAGDDGDDERALRGRRAKALKLKNSSG
jgi:HK97 family phage prohead protease